MKEDFGHYLCNASSASLQARQVAAEGTDCSRATGMSLPQRLTMSIRTGLHFHESTVDGFNFPLHAFIQTIEQPNHGFCPPSLFRFRFHVRFKPQQIIFGLRSLTKDVPPLRKKLGPKVL